MQKKLKRKDRGRGRGINKGSEEVNEMEVPCVILTHGDSYLGCYKSVSYKEPVFVNLE